LFIELELIKQDIGNDDEFNIIKYFSTITIDINNIDYIVQKKFWKLVEFPITKPLEPNYCYYDYDSIYNIYLKNGKYFKINSDEYDKLKKYIEEKEL
jgi:hypothetical protein